MGDKDLLSLLLTQQFLGNALHRGHDLLAYACECVVDECQLCNKPLVEYESSQHREMSRLKLTGISQQVS